jgi:hypothetical protein
LITNISGCESFENRKLFARLAGVLELRGTAGPEEKPQAVDRARQLKQTNTGFIPNTVEKSGVAIASLMF